MTAFWRGWAVSDVERILLALALGACSSGGGHGGPTGGAGAGAFGGGGASAGSPPVADASAGAGAGGRAGRGGGGTAGGPGAGGGASPDARPSGAVDASLPSGGQDAATTPPRDAGSLPPDPCTAAGTCPAGQWINVTPPNMPAADLRPTKNAFGPGSIVGNPARPSDLYVGGSKSGLWRSTDYGNKWTQINTQIPDVARGVVIAVAGTTPATVWAAGYRTIYKSTDGGMTFARTSIPMDLYSLKVDPNDSNHLISGLHEANGIAESTDGGTTWRLVGGANFPSGGVSWYPYFIDTGSAAGTRGTWFAIAQNGASAIMTSDGGASWTIPNGVRGLQHPHGNSQIYQNGRTIFVGGTGGPGRGVYRSTDLGLNWMRVDDGKSEQAIVWGTPKNVYAMYAWACSGCNLGTQFEVSPQPGDKWTRTAVPPALVIGPNSLVVTYDGNHHVFVGLMWDQGIWRYVEP